MRKIFVVSGFCAAAALAASAVMEARAQQAPAAPATAHHSHSRRVHPCSVGPTRRPPRSWPRLLPARTDRRRQATARQAARLRTGFKIELYAAGVPNARSLRLGDKGTVFVSSRLQDKIHAIVEKDGKREVKVIASGLHRPERHRRAQGHALHRRTVADLQNRRRSRTISTIRPNRP